MARGITAPKKPAATKQQKQWNSGETGTPLPGRTVTTPGSCTTPRCGDVADHTDETDLRAGWVRAGVYGSTEPDRVWCSGACASYGVALAELRVAWPVPRA